MQGQGLLIVIDQQALTIAELQQRVAQLQQENAVLREHQGDKEKPTA